MQADWMAIAEKLQREVKELRAEAKEHKRLKNELVLKAYPAMDAIDEIAEGFRSAVHFVRNNAMNMDRDYPEICHAEEVFSRARAALAGSGSGWRDTCATEGCGHKATVHFERGGIGSYYCHDCYVRIQALPASPSTAGER